MSSFHNNRAEIFSLSMAKEVTARGSFEPLRGFAAFILSRKIEKGGI